MGCGHGCLLARVKGTGCIGTSMVGVIVIVLINAMFRVIVMLIVSGIINAST